jgi:DNA-binding FadR family transcriptional regulator
LNALPFDLTFAGEADSIARVKGESGHTVLGQRLHPGQKVPLDAIADSIGVSRTPVRERPRLLDIKSLVTGLPNRGSVAARRSWWSPARALALDLNDQVLDLEGQA